MEELQTLVPRRVPASLGLSRSKQVSANSARDQLMHFLSYIKPSMQSYNHFCNHKSAIATAFKRVFGFDLGRDVFITNGCLAGKRNYHPDLGMIPMRPVGMWV